MSNKFLFLTLLLGSFLISNLFWFGPIDQDFFSFYYVGKEVALGQKLYGDIADNKGPAHYYFFTILYLVFENNYGLALVMGSAIIDTLSLFVIFQILRKRFSFKWSKNAFINFTFIFICLLLYKSFSIGSLMGGLYSENIGMLWLSLGIWLLGKKGSVFSGALLALSVLTRLTYLLFVPFFFVLLFFDFKDKYKLSRQFLGFSIGGLLCLGLFILYFWLNGELNPFFYNVFGQNLKFAGGPDRLILTSLFVSTSEPRIITVLVISALVVILKIFSKENFRNKAILITLFTSSFASTFTGGVGSIFYYHHFFQFNLMAIVTITQFKIFFKTKAVFLPLIFLLISFTFLNYYSFAKSAQDNISSLKAAHPNIPEIEDNKYLIVVPYYSIYYIVYDKSAPDKFFQYFFFSSNFFKNPENNIDQHRNMDKQRLRNTTFMFVNRGSSDRAIIQEYKDNFEKEFNLKKINTYHDLDATIEIYESSGK